MDESQIIMWGERRQTKEAHTVSFYLHCILEYANQSVVAKSKPSGLLGRKWGALRGGQRERTKGHKDTFGGDGYAHFLGCTNGFVDVNV